MPTDSSPPAVWVNRTQPSPTSGSGRRSGRATAANPTWAAPAGRLAAPTRPWPDWPGPTMRPPSTSTKAWSWLANRARPAASSPGRSSRWPGGGSSYWAAPTWKWSRWPPSTQSRGTQETAVTEDSMCTAAFDTTTAGAPPPASPPKPPCRAGSAAGRPGRRPGRRSPSAPLGPGGQLGPGLPDGHGRQPPGVPVDEGLHLLRARRQPAAQHPGGGLGQGRLPVGGQGEQQPGDPGPQPGRPLDPGQPGAGDQGDPPGPGVGVAGHGLQQPEPPARVEGDQRPEHVHAQLV